MTRSIEADFVVVGGGSAGCVLAIATGEPSSSVIVPANTNLPTITAAERLSDLILRVTRPGAVATPVTTARVPAQRVAIPPSTVST